MAIKLPNLLNVKGALIIGALCLTLFSVQALRIKWLKAGKKELKVELVEAYAQRDTAIEANRATLVTIAELQQANQQCAQSRELNEQNAVKELARQHGRIADIDKKYEKLRKENMQKMGCYPVRIDPDLLDQLYENKVRHKD